MKISKEPSPGVGKTQNSTRVSKMQNHLSNIAPHAKNSNPLAKALIFSLIFIIVINPYTIFGRPGIVAAFLAALYAGVRLGYKITLKEFSKPLYAMLFIGVWGAFISHFNGIGQFNHPLAVVSLAVVILAAYGIWAMCKIYRVDSYCLISMLMYSIVLNSIIILIEVNNPAARAVIESFLIPAGNINWADGFRYRGLSASGGAGLSVCTPIAFACLLYLYDNNKINSTKSIAISLILLISVLNIGRTGLILTPLVFLFYIAFYSKKLLSDSSWAIKTAALFLGVISLAVYNYDTVSYYLSDKFGDGFNNYSFGFILEGSKGLESEGTISTILHFLSVLPTGLPEALIGYGFYGGSEFYPWTDSGYARMFLSVGFFWGALFYLCIYSIYIKPIKSHKFLLYCIFAILAIAETKEPLLYSGAASRIFIIALVFSLMEEKLSFQAH